MINIVLFGPPGSGKGTQAKLLQQKFNLLQVSTGDLFRYEIGNKTELGILAKSYMDKGQLVPDTVTIGMLKNKLNANPNVAGYIFDGYPRNIAQAEALDTLMQEKGQSIHMLVALKVEDEEIVSRILNRAKTSGRSDDADESIIRKRIQVYKDETSPVFSYYQTQEKAIEIDGLGDIDDIFERLSMLIQPLVFA